MNEKQSNRRTYLRFALIILVCVVLAFPLGLLIGWSRWNLYPVASIDLLELPMLVLPIFWWLAAIAVFITTLTLYFRVRRQVNDWDGIDEDAIQAIERKLNAPLTIVNIFIALDFMYFTVLTWAVENAITVQWYLFGLAAFLFSLFVYLITTVLVVNLTKRINPEKQGHALDMDFQKKWLASCDEGEKQIIYKSAYSAYRVTSIVCLVLWGVLALLQLAGVVGVSAGVCVMAVWLVMTITYTVSAMKLGK